VMFWIAVAASAPLAWYFCLRWSAFSIIKTMESIITLCTALCRPGSRDLYPGACPLLPLLGTAMSWAKHEFEVET